MAFPEFFARIPAVTLRDPLAELLGAIPDGVAARLFGELWQERVSRILIDHADDPELVRIRPFGKKS